MTNQSFHRITDNQHYCSIKCLLILQSGFGQSTVNNLWCWFYPRWSKWQCV